MFIRLFIIFILISNFVFAQIKSPNQYFNLEIGSDKTLIDWNPISQYFDYVYNQSARVVVHEIG